MANRRTGARARETTVQVMDIHRNWMPTRCVYRSGALAITKELWSIETGRRDPVWRVVHLPSGGTIPGQPLTAHKARKVLEAVAPLLKWERYRTVEQVAALGERTKARLRQAIAEATR